MVPFEHSESPDDYRLLQELFERAVGLDESNRTIFLQQVTIDHPQLLEMLQSMLRNDIADTTTATDRSLSDVRIVEGYELLEELGRGGMGIVYKARQMNPNRVVALKMIRVGRFASERDVQRFAVEVDAIANLEHPNIVSIYEIGCHHGEHFFTMQLVSGSRFDVYLSSDDFDRSEALEILIQVCDAVGYCHRQEIVHRDLKPSNVLLDSNRKPQLTDFGLAKHLTHESNLTRTGDMMGTPGYMSPEQTHGGESSTIDAKADVYSLGAILYKILTGRVPINVAEVNLPDSIKLVQENDIIAPRLFNRWVSRTAETICMKCLSARPAERYNNADEVADELRRYVNGEPIAAKPLSTGQQWFRWCRQQPGLAVTWLVLAVLYLHHLSCVYVYDIPESQGQFHFFATAIGTIWAIGAFVFQKLLVWFRGARWILPSWMLMEVALLTTLIAQHDAATSSLCVIYLVLSAASVLRFQTKLVAYVTGLCLTSYLFQVWISAIDPQRFSVAISQAMPMAIGIVGIGVIQYFALRRSRSALEMMSKQRD
jgi:serine/threonine protein kinase